MEQGANTGGPKSDVLKWIFLGVAVLAIVGNVVMGIQVADLTKKNETLTTDKTKLTKDLDDLKAKAGKAKKYALVTEKLLDTTTEESKWLKELETLVNDTGDKDLKDLWQDFEDAYQSGDGNGAINAYFDMLTLAAEQTVKNL